MAFATPCVYSNRLVDLGNGNFAAKISDTEVLSIQPDGSMQTRPLTAIGPWETARKDGNKLVYSEARYAFPGSYAVLVVSV